jgi:hypothetical protein
MKNLFFQKDFPYKIDGEIHIFEAACLNTETKRLFLCFSDLDGKASVVISQDSLSQIKNIDGIEL